MSFGVQVKTGTLAGTLASALAGSGTEADMSLWVTQPQPNPHTRVRLFCIPYAGGGASMFHTWPAELPQEVEVCAVQLPGRESRFMEPPFTHMTPLIETLVYAMLPYLDVPFAIFGHSMGALIGFEMARQIRRQHRIEPVHLFVSGCRAPHMPNPEPPLHILPDYMLMQELRRFGGVPEEALQNGELMALLLPTLRADLALYETYVYSIDDPLRCSISAFGGLHDVKVDYQYLSAWWVQTYGSFMLRMFEGGHFFISNARKALLQAMSQDLAQLVNWWG